MVVLAQFSLFSVRDRIVLSVGAGRLMEVRSPSLILRIFCRVGSELSVSVMHLSLWWVCSS